MCQLRLTTELVAFFQSVAVVYRTRYQLGVKSGDTIAYVQPIHLKFPSGLATKTISNESLYMLGNN